LQWCTVIHALISALYKLCVYLIFLLTFFLPYFLFSLCFFSYLFTSLLVYFLTYLSTSSRIDLFCFQAGGCRRRPNLASFLGLFYILLWMHVCFCCVCFSFSVLSQEIGWEERPRNDLFCVGWDVKLNQASENSKHTPLDLFTD